MTDKTTMDCPQCGEPAELFCEGVCEACCEQNQAALDDHNARYDWWQSLSARERDAQIRWATR